MSDIVERLRAGSWANAPWEPEYKVPPTSLHLEAADEIERLKEAIKQAKREAAEHILEMWRDPWPRTERSFIDRLEAYVEELK